MATYTWQEIEAMAMEQGIKVYELIDKIVEENINQLN